MRKRVNLNIGYAEGDGNMVEVGDRMVHGEIRIYAPGIDGQPKLGVAIDSTSGVPRCVRVELVSHDDGREIRTMDVRGVEVESLIEAVVPLFSDEIVERHEGGGISAVIRVPDSYSQDFEHAKGALRKVRRASRRRVTPELLRRVAEIYRDNPRGGAEAVALAFGVADSTAFRYVRQAREQGFLEPREG